MLANVREGSTGGRSETAWDRICETGRLLAGSEREKELWISRVVNQTRNCVELSTAQELNYILLNGCSLSPVSDNGTCFLLLSKTVSVLAHLHLNFSVELFYAFTADSYSLCHCGVIKCIGKGVP